MVAKNFIRLAALSLVCFFCLIDAVVKAQTKNYQVYALFVMNIGKYSAWPSQNGEFHITVFGKSKIYEELVKLSASKTINGLSIKVNQTENLTELGNQEMVYLSDGKSSMLGDVLQVLRGKAVIIVTDREGLFRKGAGFSFVTTDNNTLRFDINNSELEKRQIKVSKTLLALANTIL
jgi:uncharacterized protein DUF4154